MIDTKKISLVSSFIGALSFFAALWLIISLSWMIFFPRYEKRLPSHFSNHGIFENNLFLHFKGVDPEQRIKVFNFLKWRASFHSYKAFASAFKEDPVIEDPSLPLGPLHEKAKKEYPLYASTIGKEIQKERIKNILWVGLPYLVALLFLTLVCCGWARILMPKKEGSTKALLYALRFFLFFLSTGGALVSIIFMGKIIGEKYTAETKEEIQFDELKTITNLLLEKLHDLKKSEKQWIVKLFCADHSNYHKPLSDQESKIREDLLEKFGGFSHGVGEIELAIEEGEREHSFQEVRELIQHVLSEIPFLEDILKERHKNSHFINSLCELKRKGETLGKEEGIYDAHQLGLLLHDEGLFGKKPYKEKMLEWLWVDVWFSLTSFFLWRMKPPLRLSLLKEEIE